MARRVRTAPRARHSPGGSPAAWNEYLERKRAADHARAGGAEPTTVSRATATTYVVVTVVHEGRSSQVVRMAGPPPCAVPDPVAVNAKAPGFERAGEQATAHVA